MISMNKKGAEQGTNMVAMVIGIILLGLVLFGGIYWYITGNNLLSDVFGNIGGGKSNLDNVRNGCELACNNKDSAKYCSEERVVNFGKEIILSGKFYNATRELLAKDLNDFKVKSITANCYTLATGDGGLKIAKKEYYVDNLGYIDLGVKFEVKDCAEIASSCDRMKDPRPAYAASTTTPAAPATPATPSNGPVLVPNN